MGSREQVDKGWFWRKSRKGERNRGEREGRKIYIYRNKMEGGKDEHYSKGRLNSSLSSGFKNQTRLPEGSHYLISNLHHNENNFQTISYSRFKSGEGSQSLVEGPRLLSKMQGLSANQSEQRRRGTSPPKRGFSPNWQRLGPQETRGWDPARLASQSPFQQVCEEQQHCTRLQLRETACSTRAPPPRGCS